MFGPKLSRFNLQTLEHPSLSKLHKMVPSLSKLSKLDCGSCQLGKHTRATFPHSPNNRAKSHFYLVHSDIWGLVELILHWVLSILLLSLMTTPAVLGFS